MSGHSKWSTIKRKKGAEDAKRSKIFTRVTKEIVTAIREGGGGDPEFNPRLRLAIDKAKAANMPKDNIERAIKKGTGQGDDGVEFEEIIYEGYAPHGVAIIVEVLTDNRNRSLAEVKHAFNRNNGTMANTGAVLWQFEQKGFIQLGGSPDFDEVFMVAADAGAEDVISEDDAVNIYTSRENLNEVAQALSQNGYEVTESQLIWVPKNEVELSADESVAVMKLIERLEELDDIQNVSSNLSLSEAAIAAFEAQ
ncbi:MAG: YebC/PmpR family DNA-binding transcriptional regulator [Anaerolineae bacterium]|nr:YebC/PmpR family DNA-binding transcriptional regulator [Anaerolineae bacterium]